jgi:hypothetical protein
MEVVISWFKRVNAKNNTYLNIGGRFYSGVVDDCRFIGNIGKIIIFSRALNDAKRSAVENISVKNGELESSRVYLKHNNYYF